MLSSPDGPVHIAWSKLIASWLSGRGTRAPSATLAETTLGALTGASSSMRLVWAISTRPSAVATMLSPRVPPSASLSVRLEASSMAQTVPVWATVPPPVGTARCGVFELANNRPARPVPVWPKARLSTRPATRYSSSGRPLVRPVMGKLMMSVVASGKAETTSAPVQRTAHRRPSGPKARSPTRVLLKCVQAVAALAALGLKISMPLPLAR